MVESWRCDDGGYFKSGLMSATDSPFSSIEGVYSLIYADPPWRYSFSRSKSRQIENHYSTMTQKEIKDLPLDDICAPNCVLYLWATAPKLPEALDVMEAWKFNYKSQMIWDKVNIGMGYWARGRHEILLIGTRGKFSPPSPDVRRPSIIRSRRTRHSAKPEVVYEYLETAHPLNKKIELFARNKRAGWTSWGLEV